MVFNTRQTVALVCAAGATLAVGGLLGWSARKLTPGGGIARLLIAGPTLVLCHYAGEATFPLVYSAVSGESA